MKKRLFLLIAALFILTAFTVAAANAASLTQTLIDKQDGYKLKYPRGWKTNTFPNSTNLVRGEVNSPDGKAGVQVRIYLYNNKSSLESFVKEYKKDFKKAMEDHWKGKMKEIKNQKRVIGKMKGIELAFDFKGSRGRFLFQQFIWRRGSRVYLFQCGAPWAERSKYESTIRAIAESFEFI